MKGKGGVAAFFGCALGITFVVGAAFLLDEDLNRRFKSQLSSVLDDTQKLVALIHKTTKDMSAESYTSKDRIADVEKQWAAVKSSLANSGIDI